MIKGWDIGFASMKPGERAILRIKPEYGYGSTGAGASIPPNSTLEFDVELLSYEENININDMTYQQRIDEVAALFSVNCRRRNSRRQETRPSRRANTQWRAPTMTKEFPTSILPSRS